ncbi:DUF58 domain-containing protein [Flaviflexus massiliensis]|uniref:DUF58 domain-containing protein n=1 Tax=Flaviflexus massiliensis TaxID=1522309 RepID=UPI0006D5831D|nr:DUF58 domain-containing protein [Flaviflexus massiliensis]
MFFTFRSVILAFLAIPAGLFSEGALWPLLVIAGVAVLCGVDWLTAGNPNDVTITRPVIKLRLGTTETTDITVSNTGTRTIRGSVRNGWPPSVKVAPAIFPISLGPGSTTVITTVVSPSRRGTIHAGPITVRTNGILGLAGKQRSRNDDAHVTVMPAFTARRFIPSRVSRLREMEGRSLLLVSGEGTEFDSLREYVRGDDVRSIDWRSTARRGETLVKSWRPERDRRIVSVLDCGRSSSIRIGDQPRIDSSIETTLLLAALAERSGDRLHVLAHDEALQLRIDPSRRSNMHQIAGALADVQPSLTQTDWLGVAAQIRHTVTAKSLIVITTALDSGVIPGGLLEAIPLMRRHTVLIAVATDPRLREMTETDGTAASAFEAAAAHRTILEERAVANHVARLGAVVVFASPEQLPAKVADAYLDLKEAGRL